MTATGSKLQPSQTSRPSMEHNTSTVVSSDERAEEYCHESSLQSAKEVETGVNVPRVTIHCQWHSCLLSTKEASPKACLEFARAHDEKDEDYWDWMFLEPMASQCQEVQRILGAYSESWCQCPYVGLQECCWCLSCILTCEFRCTAPRKVLPSLRVFGRHTLRQHDNDLKLI